MKVFSGALLVALIFPLLLAGSDVRYSTYLEPSGQPSIFVDIVADSSGNTYVLAQTDFKFAVTPKTGLTIFPGSCTVSKLNASGTALVYQTTIPANGNCGALAIDAGNNIYFTGQGTITPTAGVVQPVSKGSGNFVVKLDPLGRIAYATYLGGSGNDSITAIAADGAGNLLITGVTNSNDFPVKNAFQPVLASPLPNGFLSVLNTTGSSLVFSTYFANSAFEGVAADQVGNIFVIATGAGAQFPLKNAIQSSCPGGVSSCPGFVKFSPAGALLFSTYSPLDPSAFFPRDIGVDSLGNSYVSGDVCPNSCSPALKKMDPLSGTLQDIPLPSIVTDIGFYGLRIDGANNVYVGPRNGVQINCCLPGIRTVFPIVSVSPAGTLNFQVSPPFADARFAVGAPGNLFIGGAPSIDPFFTVQPFQPFPNVGPLVVLNGGPPIDALDTYVAGITNAADATLGTSPGGEDFGNQVLGTTSKVTVILRNMGENPLTISSVAISGADFSQTNDCTAALGAAATCSVSVTFAPSALGQRTGQIIVTSNALNGSQPIPLKGNSVSAPVPVLKFSASSLSFGDTPVGGNSAAQMVTLTSSGGAEVTFAHLDTTGDFLESNNCGTSLAIGASCTVSVIFHPTAAGSRSGTLTITDNVAGSPQTVNLTGTGGSGFVLATPNGTTPSATVSAGQTASYTINLNSVLSFAGQVAFVCSGAPAGANCTVTPSSVQLAANASTPITIMVNTTARASAVTHPVRLPGLGAAFSAILFMFSMIFVDRPRSSLRRNRFALAVLTGVLLAMIGCGGGGSAPPSTMTSGTPAGTYTIMITGNSGTVTQSQAMVLKVN